VTLLRNNTTALLQWHS
jgi:hypothetical protein